VFTVDLGAYTSGYAWSVLPGLLRFVFPSLQAEALHYSKNVYAKDEEIG